MIPYTLLQPSAKMKRIGYYYTQAYRQHILANILFSRFDPIKEIRTDTFESFEEVLTSTSSQLDNAWFGYLGYDLKNQLEHIPVDTKGMIELPNLWMQQFNTILAFNHNTQSLEIFTNKHNLSLPDPIKPRRSASEVDSLSSNMTKTEYFDKVSSIIQAIKRGDLYQANLTRKFNGTFAKKPDALSLFTTLCQHSPAPYSCILNLADTKILSSSPERFLAIDDKGHAESRPIKGSAPRYPDNEDKDNQSKKSLELSQKDRAENLMIVDLMRNDFSRGAVIGSVHVDSMFDITSYATVHHMSSTITSQKNPSISSLDFVKHCFPPGSMTGTPKIKAMEVCSALEPNARGVYSGAIGWFGGDGSVDLSVVIRTIILQDNAFEFQVGGAIIADSDPELEWQETLIKAKAMAQTLGILQEQLEAL